MTEGLSGSSTSLRDSDLRPARKRRMADPALKVSIDPRGMGALGNTLQTPLEDLYLMSRSELLGKIMVILGKDPSTNS